MGSAIQILIRLRLDLNAASAAKGILEIKERNSRSGQKYRYSCFKRKNI